MKLIVPSNKFIKAFLGLTISVFAITAIALLGMALLLIFYPEIVLQLLKLILIAVIVIGFFTVLSTAVLLVTLTNYAKKKVN